MTEQDLLMLLPEIILAVAGVLILVVDPFLRRRRSLSPLIALAACLGAVTAAALLWNAPPRLLFHDLFRVDSFLNLVRVATFASGALLLGVANRFLCREKLPRGEYCALLLFALCGTSVMAGAVDLFLLFLGLEILSLASYVLTAIRRRDGDSCEAGLKYYFIGSLSAAIMLYGIAWVFGSCGATSYRALSETLAGCADIRDVPFGLLMGLLFLLVGFFFKLAVFPFQVWAPDVYQGAPTPVTAFLASITKLAGFAALLRLAAFAKSPDGTYFQPLLLVAAVLSMIVGNLAALRQENIKRLLAYSSIAHAGYLLLGVMTASAPACAAVVFYLVVYVVMTVGAFAAATVLSGEGDARVRLDDYQGIGFTRPFVGFTLATCLVSLAGIPVTAGFVAKLTIFSAALEKGFYVPVLLALVASLIGAWYYLRVIVVMYTRTRPPGVEETPLSPGVAAVMAVCATLTLALGLFPGPLIQVATQVGSAVGLLFCPS